MSTYDPVIWYPQQTPIDPPSTLSKTQGTPSTHLRKEESMIVTCVPKKIHSNYSKNKIHINDQWRTRLLFDSKIEITSLNWFEISWFLLSSMMIEVTNIDIWSSPKNVTVYQRYTKFMKTMVGKHIILLRTIQSQPHKETINN